MTTTTQFFQKLENTKPFFKAAFEGFAGTGKTTTAALLAIGLHQKIKSKKPVVIFDTEKSARFLADLFLESKIDVVVKESRSLADLKETMRLCREGCADILIIDSISHVWESFLEAFKAKVGRTYIQFQDWGLIKPTWKREFSDPFVIDPYHVIMCGRAGYEYGNEVNEDTGKREIFQKGIKMRVEGETAYEPDILCLMQRFENVLGTKKEVWRECTVVKDRSRTIDGKTFKNPTFKEFEPVFDTILKNPALRVEQAELDSSALFKTEEEKREYLKQKDIIVEEIEGYLVKVAPASTGKDRQFKLDLIEAGFGTRSWTSVTSRSLKELQTGFEKIKEEVQKRIQPSEEITVEEIAAIK